MGLAFLYVSSVSTSCSFLRLKSSCLPGVFAQRRLIVPGPHLRKHGLHASAYATAKCHESCASHRSAATVIGIIGDTAAGVVLFMVGNM
jgi:hypothetical protein